jgi:hypothetical protein
MVEGCCEATINGYIQHKGCQEVTTYLSERNGTFTQSYCTINCPFNDCIHELKPKEKGLIFKSDIIQNVLVCYDSGMSIDQISRWYSHISVNQIRNWLRNKERIVAKLERYAPCC